VARRRERKFFTLLCADENVGFYCHRPPDEDRLSNTLKRSRQFRMSRTKAPCGPFAMNEKLSASALDCVPLDLAGVVRHVVEQSQPDFGKHFGKRGPRQMRDDLPVSQRTICGRTHGAEPQRASSRRRIAFPSFERMGAQASSRSGMGW